MIGCKSSPKRHILRKGKIRFKEEIMEAKSDFNLREYYLRYAINLVEILDINDKMMEFIFFIINLEARRNIIDFIYKKETPVSESDDPNIDKYRDNYDDIIASLRQRDLSMHDLMYDINRSRVKIDERDLKRFIIDVLKSEHAPLPKVSNNKFKERLNELKYIFDLDSYDLQIISFIYCTYYVNATKFNNIMDDVEFNDFLRILSSALEIPVNILKNKLKYSGKMYLSSIISNISLYNRRSQFVDLDEGIADFLSGLSDRSLVEKYIKQDRGKSIGIKNFSIPDNHIDIIKSLLASPHGANILLYGKAGTGKTEFARSISSISGENIYHLQYGDDKNKRGNRGSTSDADNRLIALTVAINTVESRDGILIVDEADFLLNTRSMFFNVSSAVEKGWLNNLLDKSHAKIIWITNEVGLMEESTLRRFSYSLYFDEFTDTDRSNIWMNLIKKHPCKKYISKTTIEKLSTDYSVNAGGIASSLDAVARIFSGKHPEKKEIETVLRDLLEKHESLTRGTFGGKKKDSLFKLTDKYDLSALNMNMDKERLLSSVQKFTHSLKNTKDAQMNMNLLFWGPPGTGKTEFAKYIAEQSSMKLIYKRYSDLESPYVGVTEQNIAQAFRKASADMAILFIDEADSFFTSRDSAHRSWEVSRTNEFLTQMENFTGILICCTNLLATLDSAAMRRFTWKVEFKYLSNDAKISLYRKYFNIAGVALPDELKKRIMNIPNLTPGDFKAVWQKFNYMPEEGLSHDEIVSELENEVSYKSNEKAIGFS